MLHISIGLSLSHDIGMAASHPELLGVCLFYLCIAIAGFAMYYAPDHAFRTRRKPGWLGLIVLIYGISGLFACLAPFD